jgi:hypothetical protein
MVLVNPPILTIIRGAANQTCGEFSFSKTGDFSREDRRLFTAVLRIVCKSGPRSFGILLEEKVFLLFVNFGNCGYRRSNFGRRTDATHGVKNERTPAQERTEDFPTPEKGALDGKKAQR